MDENARNQKDQQKELEAQKQVLEAMKGKADPDAICNGATTDAFQYCDIRCADCVKRCKQPNQGC